MLSAVGVIYNAQTRNALKSGTANPPKGYLEECTVHMNNIRTTYSYCRDRASDKGHCPSTTAVIKIQAAQS